jgi:phytoene dehydrogenase-like protein
MTKKYDIIVIGAGHNGLVNAAYLAKAGKKVLVLERRELVGGATVTEEIFPGFKFSVFSYLVSLLRPDIIRDLSLPKHGLMLLPFEASLTPGQNGDYIYKDGDHYRTLRHMARLSPRDAEAYDEYKHTMNHMARAAKYFQDRRMPDPVRLNAEDRVDLAGMGRHLRGLGPEKLSTLMKLMTMSSADFLEEWFEHDLVITDLTSSGIIGSFLGPRSPGTAYVLLHHYMGEVDGVFRAWGFAKGGTGAVATAIAGAAREFGAEIRLNAPVAEVIVKDGMATGVALENGDELPADLIVSGVDPKRTFLQLVDPALLPADFVRAIQTYNILGSSAKVNLALDALPEFDCIPGNGPHLRAAISISPSLDYIEQAYDDAKYGEFSRKPYLDLLIPSLLDPEMAPPGKHVMTCFVQYAPYHLKEGSWDERRDALGDAVIDALADHISNIRDIIIGRQVMTPLDIERTAGITGGNIFHGELRLSQLLFSRPAPGYIQYRTPIKNYYQCGSGNHPGGGISGAPGRLAALEILKDHPHDV